MRHTNKPEILIVSVTGPGPRVDTALVVNNAGQYRMILSESEHNLAGLDPINEATENLCDVLDTSYSYVDIQFNAGKWQWTDLMDRWSREAKTANPEASQA